MYLRLVLQFCVVTSEFVISWQTTQQQAALDYNRKHKGLRKETWLDIED
jgi:hypothetical protein